MKEFNRQLIAKNLRSAIEELAKKTGLSRYQVDNILYCRASKLSNLQKVAIILNFSIENLLSNQDFMVKSNPVDIKVYAQVISAIDKAAKTNFTIIQQPDRSNK